MVSRCEHDMLVLVEIEVFRHRRSIIQLVGDLRKLLKTGPAHAHRLQTIGQTIAKSSTRYGNFFAPARSLVEMAFRHPALIVATTHRTLFGTAQALHMWWQFQICGTSSSGPLNNR
jgi:hypothetical protein